MTKAEELKVLDKIEALIKSAGADSYIGPTFAGIVEICRSNIENDFGNHPLEDLEAARKKAEMLDDIAHKALAERDKMQEDLDTMSAAYRRAVEAMNAARPYAIQAARDGERALRSLEEDTDGDTIAYTFRMMKKADQAVHLTAAVQQEAYAAPLVYAMEHGKTA